MLAKEFAQPSSHADSIAILPCRQHRHSPMPTASPFSHAILLSRTPMLSCLAVLPRDNPMLSSHANSIASHANDINIPLPMLYICFSTNYKPFAMLLPLCGLVLLFCCTFFKASFNCASIAPIAELYRSLLCHLSVYTQHRPVSVHTASLTVRGDTASPSVRGDTASLNSIAHSFAIRQGRHSIAIYQRDTASPSVRGRQHH